MRGNKTGTIWTYRTIFWGGDFSLIFARLKNRRQTRYLYMETFQVPLFLSGPGLSIRAGAFIPSHSIRAIMKYHPYSSHHPDSIPSWDQQAHVWIDRGERAVHKGIAFTGSIVTAGLCIGTSLIAALAHAGIKGLRGAQACSLLTADHLQRRKTGRQTGRSPFM